ncbi:MAG: tRNA pseudouridine synthase A [Saprospiraceae bacterium]|nr:MAG: tRNA pseudouridine synthase A [Saprospiraceae bacterium]
MRYFFHIGYKGNQYRGWQRQAGVISIQETLEENIGQVLKKRVRCIGCGRTDAGVNANQYFFHLDMDKSPDPDLLFVLNKTLPKDIAIIDIIPVGDRAHAQYDATARTYQYFIHTVKDPFLADLSALYLVKELNLQQMQEAVALLPRYSDFRSFCKTPDKHNNTICKVTSASLIADTDAQHLCFQITANRFLRGMIRLIVGNLMEVGQGKLSVPTFERYLMGLEQPKFTLYAYPQGLYLAKVTYPFLDIPSKLELPTALSQLVFND